MSVPEHSSGESSAKISGGQSTSSIFRSKDDLIVCVDKGLGVFASDDYRAVYWRKKLIAQISSQNPTEDDILRNPESFLQAIETTFGLGAWAIERAITKEIRNKFELEPAQSRGLVQAIKTASGRFPDVSQVILEVSKPSTTQRRSFLEPLRSFASLARSEYRVTMFVWSLVIAYLLATNLKPNLLQIGELVIAWYFVSFGVYVFNALTDVEEDRIDHPGRPLASRSVPVQDAWGIFVVAEGIGFATSLLVGIPCLIFVLASFLLGIAYSHPSVRAKRRFPFKVLVSVSGAVIVSICGGIVAGNLNAAVYFSAVFFGLFAMVTLLLGDVSDIRGDTAAGVKSLPVVIGARNSIFLISCIPLAIAFIGVAFFRMANLNPLFPFLIVIITAYSSLNIISLLGKYDDYEFVGRVKSRMRLVHFAIQFSLLLGLLAL
jgi:geranylgeranylglycerol-phosphate geranylgeranyltransferase